MKATTLLLLAILGTAVASRGLKADSYPILEEYAPSYNMLNITGWDDYPEGCWLFPLPAINVVIDEVVYLLSAKTDEKDTSNGADVAMAWCWMNGFDAVGEFKLRDFSEMQFVRSVEIGTGNTCEGYGAPGGAGAPCSALHYVECLKDKATTGCSRRFTSNLGINNMGYGNSGEAGQTGSTNVGNFNMGSTNLGDGNMGSTNVGSFNVGSTNYGNCNVGDVIKGDFIQCEPTIPMA